MDFGTARGERVGQNLEMIFELKESLGSGKKLDFFCWRQVRKKHASLSNSSRGWYRLCPAHLFFFFVPFISGAFGDVYRAVHKDAGFEIAVKTIPATNEAAVNDIKNEVSVLQKCRNR